MDVFMKDDYYSQQNNYSYENTIADDERTIIDRNRNPENVNTSYSQSYATSSAGYTSKPENNTNVTIGWLIGIAVAIIVGFVVYNHLGGTNETSDVDSSSDKIETSLTSTTQESETDIYRERVLQFANKQSGVIVSYPNDSRYCVYFSKKTTYNHKELYRYDATSESVEHVNLPIQATIGYTESWLTKNNRYIFIAAEERYTDFIRLDTQTRQVTYITNCYSLERSSSGFTVTKARCINEDTATCSADMEYAYTEYYYDEEGECLGHRDEYR